MRFYGAGGVSKIPNYHSEQFGATPRFLSKHTLAKDHPGVFADMDFDIDFV